MHPSTEVIKDIIDNFLNIFLVSYFVCKEWSHCEHKNIMREAARGGLADVHHCILSALAMEVCGQLCYA